MKKAAIYMRVSTARQEEEQTIESQRMELLKRVEEDGHLLLPEYTYEDDGWTGMTLKRPALDQLRSDAIENKFDILYFYDRGRIARKYTFQELVFDELRELRIEFLSLHDINGESSEEILMGGVMGIFHEYERLKITERMRLGKFRKVRENKKLLGYQPKYGYTYYHRIKTGSGARDGYFGINQKQAIVVRQIFEWVASGMSKHEVRRQLFKMGIAPPKGKREQWSSGTLDRLVRDTTYFGEHYYNKSESVPTKNPHHPEQEYRKVLKGSRIPRPKEQWLLIKVPAIITRDLFDKVQVQLARNKRANSRNNSKHHYLLSSLIECPCGCARTGDPASKGSLYYRCTDRLNTFPGTRKCYEHGINVAVIDSLVWKSINELLTQPEILLEQAERWQKDASPLKAQLEILKTVLKSLEEKELRYAKAYGEGDDVMPIQIYKDNMYELNKKREQILSELAGIEDSLANRPIVPLEQLIDGVVKLVERLDFNNKQFVIRKLVTKIVATKKEVTVWGRIPLLSTEQVGLDGKYWNRRPTKCWQINSF